MKNPSTSECDGIPESPPGTCTTNRSENREEPPDTMKEPLNTARDGGLPLHHGKKGQPEMITKLQMQPNQSFRRLQHNLFGRAPSPDVSEPNAMDPDINVVLQIPSPAELTLGHVRAELSPAYSRRPLPGLEASIAEAWAERRCRQPWLFDGAKFRFHSAELRDGRLLLRLGLTSYRDYLGTNWSARAPALRQRGLADWGDSQAYLAEPLGVGAMLHTADDCFVFLRRSDQVAEAPGMLDIPGGHPEPKAVAGDIQEDSIRLEHLSAELVIQELFASVLGEIRDEVNLPLDSLSRPVLLGIVRNNRSAGRASAEFYVRCKLTSEGVRQRYLIGGPEAQESTNIIFISQKGVLELEEGTSRWQELCPSAKGGVKLYSLVHMKLD